MTQPMHNALSKFLLLLPLALAACGQQEAKNGATQVLVTIDSDLRGDLAKVEVQVLDVRAEVAGSGRNFEIKGDDSWPISFAVSPTRGKESGSFLVVARGMDAKGELLSEAKGLLTFIKGKSTTASLWLLAACRGVTCEGLQTCNGRGSQAGTCDSVPVLDTMIVEAGDPAATPGGMTPTLTPPMSGTSTGMDPTLVGGSQEAGVSNGTANEGGVGADGGPVAVVPRVANTPTLGGFATLSEPRSAGGLLLLDDGFEPGERVCNAAGQCAIASFAP